MTAQDSAKIIRQVYEFFAKADLVIVSKRFASEIRWNVTGHSALAGTYSGPEAVFAFFARLTEMSGGTFTTEIHDLMASEDHVVVLARESGVRSDRHLQDDEAHVWHLENGLAKEFWGCPKDPYAVDAFWN